MLNNSFMNKGIRNISYTFMAQGITLLISLIKALWIPKMLGVEEFSYWQLYVFYSSYVGFFQFGINDGIYLRYGGAKFNDLNKELFRSQFWLLTLSQLSLAVFLILISGSFSDDIRSNIWVYTSLCLLISGVSAFFWFIFQSTNRIKDYAVALIIDKVIFLLLVLFLLNFNVLDFEYFIVADLISKTLSLIFCMFIGKELILGKVSSFKVSIKELFNNVSVGMKLMIANIASMLILGVGRFAIDHTWGITTFGQLSLTLSIISLGLLFINAVSVVLFPALRMIPKSQLVETYLALRTLLVIILFSVLILYTPFQYLLNLWLPEYSKSIKYLAILFPIIIFDGKMQMLVATYLKVIRKENSLLMTNIIAVIASILMCSYSAIVLHNINLVIISMIVVVAIRCLIAEIFLSSELGISLVKNTISEILLVGIFIISTWYLNGILSMIIYIIFYLFFLIYLKKDIIGTVSIIRRVSKK
ncbi:oligosaccharide flippase family protein [Peribacillus butanolivorans]|uniref:oligosaccharide flippase family protein n=1 Tax=Peribacillus butanolivorans TaxID=421767 RepID=UPI0036D8CEC8